MCPIQDTIFGGNYMATGFRNIEYMSRQVLSMAPTIGKIPMFAQFVSMWAKQLQQGVENDNKIEKAITNRNSFL